VPYGIKSKTVKDAYLSQVAFDEFS
jgi:hypothetical protein